MKMKRRARGGKMVNLNDDPDGEQEPTKAAIVSGKKSVLALAHKTSGSGFATGGSIPAKKDGGAISGSASAPSLAKRARGGRTSAPFSSANSTSNRQGSSSSGHEGE